MVTVFFHSLSKHLPNANTIDLIRSKIIKTVPKSTQELMFFLLLNICFLVTVYTNVDEHRVLNENGP